MRKATILGIVPNEAIRMNLLQSAGAFCDIELDVVVSNFYEAVTLVEEKGGEYDVVMARGETFRMISDASDIPLVEIPLSILDILHAQQLAENFHMPYVILGFKNLTDSARLLKDLMKSRVEIFTLSRFEEANDMMQDIHNKGYRLIVTGMGTEHIARRYGLNTIQVNTGAETLDSCLRQARLTALNIAKAKARSERLKSIIGASDTDFVLFDSDGETMVMEHFAGIDRQRALNIATRELQLSTKGDANLVKTIDRTVWKVLRREFSTDGQAYTVFFFQKQGMVSPSYRSEIAVYSKDSAIDAFLSHFPETSRTVQTSPEMLDELAASPLPVLLIGERGTGKNQIAASIYTRSRYQNHPYYCINFNLSSEKTWNYLLSNMNSPVFSNENTIFLQNLDHLPKTRLEKLTFFLRDSSAAGRNKLILSYGIDPGSRMPQPVQKLLDELVCLDLTIKPLRQRRAELHTLTGLYIATANLSYGKHVVGMDEDAERLILDYPWPDNLLQFNRVMNKLVSLSSSSYISRSDVENVLNAESSFLTSSTALSSVLNIDRPLHETEKEIVKAMLARTKGNRSLAASRLKISRTTLWRFLQDEEIPEEPKEDK